MNKHHKTGRLLYYIGTFASALGIAFVLIKDTLEPLSVIAMPLIIIGVILLIASNFLGKIKMRIKRNNILPEKSASP